MDGGLLHLPALPLLPCPHQCPLPKPEHSFPPFHRPRHLHGALALQWKPAGLHHFPPAFPVLSAPGPHPSLLPAHLPATTPAEGHGRPGAGGQKESQGLPEGEHHASLHRGDIRPLLAPIECLQYGVRLEPRGHLHLPARCHLLRLPPYGYGLHLCQPHHLRLPQQQLPERAEGHSAPLPLLGHARELRKLPSLHSQHRGHEGVITEQWVFWCQCLVEIES